MTWQRLREAYLAWLGASLVRRTTAHVAFGLAIIVAIGTSISVFSTYYFLRERKQQELDLRADAIAEHFTATLNDWQGSIASLARNRVLANALLDSFGREQYLVPFMREFDMRVEEHLGLTLCDYLNRPLAANGLGDPLCYGQYDNFKKTIDTGEATAFMAREGHRWVMVLMVPVLYPATKSVEGLLVGRLDMSAWFDNPIHFPMGFRAQLHTGSDKAPVFGAEHALHGLETWRRQPLQAPLAAFDFRLHVGGSQVDLPFYTPSFLLGPLASALLLLSLGVFFARRLARRLSRPLLELADTSERIAEGQHTLRADDRRRDELGTLARNYNKMLERLEAAQHNLEARIADRTQALAVSERRERQRAEELDSLLDAVPALVMYTSHADCRQIRINEAMRELLRSCGLPVDGVIDAALLDRARIRHFGAPVRFADTPLAQAAREGSPVSNFACEVTPDTGKQRHLLGSAYPLMHQDFHQGAIAAFTDVTALRQAEDELAEQTERYHRLFDLLPEGLLVYEDNVIQMSNTTLARMTGYESAEQLVGQHVYSFVHEDDRAAFAAMHAALTGHGREGRVQGFRLIRRDGSLLHAEISPGTVCLGKNQVVQAVIRDISKRIAAEEQTQLAARVFEASQDGIFITDADNRIISVNPAFTERTGFSLDEARGNSPTMLATNQHEDDYFREMWQALASQGHWENEILNRHKDGHLMAQWMSISAIRDGEGNLSHYIAVLSDVTDRNASLARMAYLAQHDYLTGLPNRVLLMDRLGQALSGAKRDHKSVAILYLDLDGFKQVNDGYGHAIGDEVLKRVTERMQGQLRAMDTLARIGGDEFVILLMDLPYADAYSVVADKLCRAVEPPYVVGTLKLDSITASIGIALYPDCGDSPEQLLESADRAMYAAKASGKNRYEVCAIEAQSDAGGRSVIIPIREDLS